MAISSGDGPFSSGLSPYGERGLKFSLGQNRAVKARLSPYGERGLKSVVCQFAPQTLASLPVWGEGIEMLSLVDGG